MLRFIIKKILGMVIAELRKGEGGSDNFNVRIRKVQWTKADREYMGAVVQSETWGKVRVIMEDFAIEDVIPVGGIPPVNLERAVGKATGRRAAMVWFESMLAKQEDEKGLPVEKLTGHTEPPLGEAELDKAGEDYSEIQFQDD